MDFSQLPQDPMYTWWPYLASIAVGIITMIRAYMGGVQCPNSNRIDGKVVIITGATSGIGFEMAKELAKRGGQIIMCGRNLQNGVKAINMIKSEIPGVNVTLKTLDLCLKSSIINFVKCFENIKVDILINNAGVCYHPFFLTEDSFEIHLATNYLGHFLLTHMLMDSLKMSDHGRIINVSAGNYHPAGMPLSATPVQRGFSSKEWFAQSKLALIFMAKHMSTLLKGTNVTINSLNPGLVRNTQHNRHSVVLSHWAARLPVLPWMWLLMKSPQQGAQTGIYLATDPTLAGVTGKYFNDCSEEKLGDHAENTKEEKVLYQKTCTLLNIESMKENEREEKLNNT